MGQHTRTNTSASTFERAGANIRGLDDVAYLTLPVQGPELPRIVRALPTCNVRDLVVHQGRGAVGGGAAALEGIEACGLDFRKRVVLD